MSDWLEQLKTAKKTCRINANLKKIHYEFENGLEMVEEYNLETDVMTRRAWKKSNDLCNKEDSWDIEVGDPLPVFKDDYLIKENASQPIVTRRNTKRNMEWRIRNLPFPINVYSVTIEKSTYSLIVGTTNKKYFKKLIVTDLQRLNIQLDQNNVSFSHRYNTLIISYKKPQELLKFESVLSEEIKNIETNEDECKIN